jgi:branched-chain amino acid transport system permease protein
MTLLGLHLSITLLDLLLLNTLLAYSAYPVFNVGRMNMSFVAFAGLGGYTCAILVHRSHWNPWWSLLVGMVLSASIALPLGLILGRVRGVYLGIATINLVAVFQVFIVNMPSLTGGAEGLPNLPIIVKTWYLAVAVVVIAAGFFLLERSRYGAGIRMQRVDELLAVSSGVFTNQNVSIMFVASATIGALQGGLTAFWYGFVSPDTYSFTFVILAVAMVMLGGTTQWTGPLIGAVFFTILPEWLRSFGVYRNLATGVVLLFVVFFFPEGIAGAVISWRGLRRARTSAESTLRGAGAKSPGAESTEAAV